MIDRDRRAEPLDAAADPLRWEAAVGAILEAAGPELARRRQSQGALTVLVGWARPVLAAAASLVLLASAALVGAGGGAPADLTAAGTNTVAEALVPAEVAAWLETGHEMTAGDFYAALNEY